MITKGVKAFKLTEDGKLITGGIGGSIPTEWEVGKVYDLENDLPLELCENGFHFYREKDACFGVDLFGPQTVFYTIEAYGEVLNDTEKCVCKSIILLEEFTPELDGDRNSGYLNSGNWNSGYLNSGYRNSGNQNSGNQNSGYRNSGDRNSGNRNSGDWNSGDRNSGYLNSETPQTIRVFNKDCSLEEWEMAKKPIFLYFNINDGETYKDAFRRSWEQAADEDRALLEKLPNFDWSVFAEISGIEKPQEGQP